MNSLFRKLLSGSLHRNLPLFSALFILVILLSYSVMVKLYLMAPGEKLRSELTHLLQKELQEKLSGKVTPENVQKALLDAGMKGTGLNLTVFEGERPIYSFDPAQAKAISQGSDTERYQKLYQELYERARTADDPELFILHRNSTSYLFYLTFRDERTAAGVVLLLAVLFFCALIYFFISRFLSAALEPVDQLIDSIDTLMETGASEGVYSYDDNEIGEAISRYNSLVGRYEELCRVGSLEIAEELFQDDHDKHTDVAKFLQEKLFERPFPRFQEIEIVLFPKNPSYESKEFLSADGDGGGLRMLLGHFDVHSIETLLLKHRLQEKFLTMAAAEPECIVMARALWEDMLDDIDFGPGFLYLEALENQQSLRFYRSGPFFLFMIPSDGDCRVITGGESYFSTDFDGISEESLEPGDTLLSLSGELMEMMGVNPDQFCAQILDVVDGVKNGVTPRNLLSRILEEISRRYSLGSDFIGLINLVHFRNRNQE